MDGSNATCQPHGSCVDSGLGHVCQCDEGWTGSSCKCSFFGGKVCGGHGECRRGVDVGSPCKCDLGWGGEQGNDCSRCFVLDGGDVSHCAEISGEDEGGSMTKNLASVVLVLALVGGALYVVMKFVAR